jgi:hypothetical protein
MCTSGMGTPPAGCNLALIGQCCSQAPAGGPRGTAARLQQLPMKQVVTLDGSHPPVELVTVAAPPEPRWFSPAVPSACLPWAALGPRTTGKPWYQRTVAVSRRQVRTHAGDWPRSKDRPASTLKATVQGEPILAVLGMRCSISTRPELAASPPLVAVRTASAQSSCHVQHAAESVAGATAPVRCCCSTGTSCRGRTAA